MSKYRKYAILTLVAFMFNLIVPTINVQATSRLNSEDMEMLDNNLEEAIEVNEKEVVQKEETVLRTTTNTIVSNLENPLGTHRVTEDFYIKGWAISKEGISKIQVYIDNVLYAHATYGLERKDIGEKYKEYPNASKSGFEYKFKNVSNGEHDLKIVVNDAKGNTNTHTAKVIVSNKKTSIMGTGKLSRGQMINLLIANNPKKSVKYASEFVDFTIKEAKAEGINHDILFSQMMHETGYLKFGGDVKEQQNNFAGIGATGNGEPGNSFPSIEIGIRAVTQHLKAYASTEPLNQECVDPRFDYVSRGVAPYLEILGIKENPEGKGWATAKEYGYMILSLIEKAQGLSSTINFSNVTGATVTGSPTVGSKLVFTASAEPSSETLYKLWVCDRSTNNWILLSDYSTKKSVEYTPSKAGQYTFVVHAKHKNSSNSEYDDYKSVDVDISNNNSEGKSIVKNLSVTGNAAVNSKLTMTAEGTPNADTLYKLWVADRSTDKWILLSDYSSKNSTEFLPTKAGKYSFVVHVKHKNSNTTTYDDYKAVDITVSESKSTVKSLQVTGDKLVNSKLTMKAEGTPSSDTLYKLWIADRSTNKWTVLSEYSSKNIIEYVPTKAGKYSFVVHVKHKNSSSKDYDDYRSVDVQIGKAESKVESLTVTEGRNVNSELTMTAKGTPSSDTLYKLWIADKSTDKWTLLSDYSNNNIAKYTPTKPGDYRFVAHVKHRNSDTETYDDYKAIDVTVKGSKSQVTSLDVTGDKLVNSKLTMKAEGTPSSDTLYKLWVADRSTNKWTVLSEYSSKNTIEYVPTKAGKYSFVVHVKHKNSATETYDDYKAIDVTVKELKSKATSLAINGETSIGNQITISAEGTPSDSTLYKIWLADRSTGEWILLSDYSNKKSVKYTPNKVGEYTISIHMKNKYSSSENYDDYIAKDIYVTPKGVSVARSLNITGELKKNNPLTITAEAAPKDTTLYKIWVCDRTTGKWTLLSDYSANNTAKFTPVNDGTYTISVHVKHKNNKTEDYDDYIAKDIVIQSSKTIVIDPGHNNGGDFGAVATHNGVKYSETDLNMQVAEYLRLELEGRGYKVIMTRKKGEILTDPLRESLMKRVEITNINKADLFVSIHQNSSTSPSANGVEVYYSSEAPSTLGLLLENGIEKSLQPVKNQLIRAETEKVTKSRALATDMVNAIASQMGYYNRGAKDEEFYVVKNTTMPSVLVECGFISNPTEAVKLANPTNQKKLATILANSVEKSFR